MGKIITFYSYKGGVGRTMALANVAVLLSQWKYKVLIVDWDLEAPGLEFFFKDFLSLEKVYQKEGIIELLCDCSVNTAKFVSSPKWQNFCLELHLAEDSIPLHFLSAGKKDNDYFSKVTGLDLEEFYSDRNGGLFIESLRDEWKQEYDFILVDSRTGITDIGGICTVQLPDILVLFFTATEQSLKGTIEVAKNAELARYKLPVDRETLLSLPILSRFDDKEEFKISQYWLDRVDKELSEIYADWLPTSIKNRDFIEITKIPYLAYFSFGEKLPVLEQGTISPQGLGYTYETLSALIANQLKSIEHLMDNRSEFVKSVCNIISSKNVNLNSQQKTQNVKQQNIKQQIEIIIQQANLTKDVATINLNYDKEATFYALTTILFKKQLYKFSQEILNDPELNETHITLIQFKIEKILFEYAKNSDFYINKLLETLKEWLPEADQQVEEYSLLNQSVLPLGVAYCGYRLSLLESREYDKYPLFATLKKDDDESVKKLRLLIYWIFHPGLQHVLDKSLRAEGISESYINVNALRANLIEIWFLILGVGKETVDQEALAISEMLLQQIDYVISNTYDAKMGKQIKKALTEFWKSEQNIYLARTAEQTERRQKDELKLKRSNLLTLRKRFERAC